jgi:hypothetical protein
MEIVVKYCGSVFDGDLAQTVQGEASLDLALLADGTLRINKISYGPYYKLKLADRG